MNTAQNRTRNNHTTVAVEVENFTGPAGNLFLFNNVQSATYGTAFFACHTSLCKNPMQKSCAKCTAPIGKTPNENTVNKLTE